MVSFAGNATGVILNGALNGIGGGVQRMAWDNSENVGMMVTGLSIIAGTLLPVLGIRGPMVQAVATSLFNSGTSVAGWITAERVVLGRASSGSMLPGGRRRVATARSPEASVSGRNPNTGEQILGSNV